jgi:hypothetical protein
MALVSMLLSLSNTFESKETECHLAALVSVFFHYSLLCCEVFADTMTGGDALVAGDVPANAVSLLLRWVRSHHESWGFVVDESAKRGSHVKDVSLISRLGLAVLRPLLVGRGRCVYHYHAGELCAGRVVCSCAPCVEVPVILSRNPVLSKDSAVPADVSDGKVILCHTTDVSPILLFFRSCRGGC